MIAARALALCFLLGLAGLPATAADSAEASITYLTGSSVYVDAGSDDGLRPGDRLSVDREGETVATLEVTEVSSRRSVNAVVEGDATLKVGDQVRFEAKPRAAVTTAPAATADSGTSAPAARRRTGGGLAGSGIHGRVGVRFLGIRDQSGYGADVSQPGIDLRLDGPNIAGSDFGLAVDVRTRRNSQTLAGREEVTETRSRVYRLAASWQAFGSPWQVVLGRQISPDLAMVSTFDGLSARYVKPRWSVGGFTGTQPDAADFGYSSNVREHGAYFQYRNAPQTPKYWSITTGLVASYFEGEINREFLYVQGRYSAKKLSFYGTTEIDFNRDWKEEAGEDSLSLTSGFFSVHYRVSKAVTLRGGFDDRRNVRLYRDQVTPETEFDDTYRQGAWGGVGLRFANRYSASLDARQASGGSAGTADSYTATVGVDRLTKANLAFRLRGTSYSNDRSEGWLGVLSAGLNLSQLVYLQIHGGVRDEQNLVNPVFDDQMTWYGLDLDFNLGRRWYLLLSYENTEGDLEALDQFFTRLSYRF